MSATSQEPQGALKRWSTRWTPCIQAAKPRIVYSRGNQASEQAAGMVRITVNVIPQGSVQEVIMDDDDMHTADPTPAVEKPIEGRGFEGRGSPP